MHPLHQLRQVCGTFPEVAQERLRRLVHRRERLLRHDDAATERTPSSRQCCGEHGRLPRRGVQSEPRRCPGGEVRHRRLAVIRGVAVPEGGVSVAALAARWSVLHGLPRKIWRRRHATIAPYWSTYGLADAGQGGLLCGDGCVEMFSRTRKRCLGRGTPGAIRETRRIRRASCGISVP